MEDFNVLLKNHEDVKNDIIKSFSMDLMNEINKLVVKYGKDELMRLIAKDVS